MSSPSYLSFWHMQSPAFTLMRAPHDFFAVASQKQLITEAVRKLDDQLSPLIVHGAPGSGKSSLARLLQHHLNEHAEENVLFTPLGLSWKNGWLMHSLSQYLTGEALANQHDDEWMGKLLDQVEDLERLGKRLIVGVDFPSLDLDTHTWADFSAIEHLKSHRSVALHIVIWLTTAQWQALQKTELSWLPRSHHLTISPLTKEETQQFLLATCQKAGLPPDIFHDEIISWLHQTTHGNLASLCVHAENLLISAFQKGRHEIMIPAELETSPKAVVNRVEKAAPSSQKARQEVPLAALLRLPK